MSVRANVSLGVWVLFMVLIGTMTVGIDLAFLVFMVIGLGVAVAFLMFLRSRRSPDRQLARVRQSACSGAA